MFFPMAQSYQTTTTTRLRRQKWWEWISSISRQRRRRNSSVGWYWTSNSNEVVLPSGKHVEDIFNENISQLTKSTKVKEKLDAIERAALSFPLSNLNSWKKITRPSYKILTWKKRLIFILCLDGSKWPNKAYKYCIHINSVVNTCIYKISKIYDDLFFFSIIIFTLS